MENRTYADSFRILGSMTDINIDFASSHPKIGENGAIIGEDNVLEQKIILSLPLAKELAKKLTGAVADYESRL